MTRLTIPLAIVVAFGIGRLSVFEPNQLPSVPVALLQRTQPIAVTIEVELDSPPQLLADSSWVYELRGTAEYRFTNISAQPIRLAFPPVRVFSITGNSVDTGDCPCPPCLAQQQTIEIPPNQYVTFSGDWASVVSGDIDGFLQPSAGHHGFSFRPPEIRDSASDFCSDTLIAFQAFKYKGRLSDWLTVDQHLKLVSGNAELTPYKNDGRTRP